MEYLRGLRVLREDPDWFSKVAVGGLLLASTVIIPIFGQIVIMGWAAHTLRRTLQGTNTPLPDLNFDWNIWTKHYLGPGLKAFVVNLVWVVPPVILSVALMCVASGVAAVTVDGQSPAPWSSITVLLLGLLSIIAYTLVLAASLVGQMASMITMATDEIKDGLDFKAVLAFTKRHLTQILMGALIIGTTAFGLALLGLLVLCVGVALVPPVVLVMQVHHFAQMYQDDRLNPAQPGPVDEPLPASEPGPPTPA